MNAWLRNLRPNETSQLIAYQLRPFCKEKSCQVYIRKNTIGIPTVRGIKHSNSCDKKYRQRFDENNT